MTQLVNSMLGLLVFPRERFLDQIPQTSLSDLEADGFQAFEQGAGVGGKFIHDLGDGFGPLALG